jgi:hypothetical protein
MRRELHARQIEYAGFPEFFATSNLPANQAGTVFGAFLSKLPEPWSNRLGADPIELMTLKEMFSRAIEVAGFEKAISDWQVK